MLANVITNWGGYSVTPMELYTDVFKLDEPWIQCSTDEPGEFKSNPLVYYQNEGESFMRKRVLFRDTFEEVLSEVQQAEFSIISGLTYFGKKRTNDRAARMYAMIFDLDGVTEETLNNFMSGSLCAGAYPVPNYIVLSGHSVHLYYVFQVPIDLYPYTKVRLKELKYSLTQKMWNGYTSTEKKIQFQGINQGFRVVGGRTKEGCSLTHTEAFRVNEDSWTYSELCKWLPFDFKKPMNEDMLFKESKYTLEEAKLKFPDWYQRVIVNGDKGRRYWNIAEKVNGPDPFALYHWWIRQIHEGASYGHRYFDIMALSIYAIKNDVPYEVLEKDSLELIPFLNDLKPEQPFTKEDVYSALECYDARYKTFPVGDIEKISGINIPRNKRNGLTQKNHLEVARMIQMVKDRQQGTNWREGNGRKPKREVVKEWQAEHPNGKKADCVRETGLSKPTVYKWWQD